MTSARNFIFHNEKLGAGKNKGKNKPYLKVWRELCGIMGDKVGF